MIFLFPRWDMLISRRVPPCFELVGDLSSDFAGKDGRDWSQVVVVSKQFCLIPILEETIQFDLRIVIQ